jgi:spore maturation protein CgeD
MKITCILTSFNRPSWVRQAIASVAEQTHKDYELLVMDESTTFDIQKTLEEFRLPSVRVFHHDISPKERASVNRLSANINEGLRAATGDLICYLADDDFYFPGWFSAASAFFKTNLSISAAFGKLRYTRSRDREYPKDGKVIVFETPIEDPFCRLDHNQIIHRRFSPPILWPEEPGTIGGPDAYYMRLVGKKYPFHPIAEWAAVKRMHDKNLQNAVQLYRAGKMDGSRE